MAPHKFARIRKQYRISNSKYLDSLSKVGGERKGRVVCSVVMIVMMMVTVVMVCALWW